MQTELGSCQTFSMAVSSSTASWCRCAVLSLPRAPPSSVPISDDDDRGLLPPTDCAQHQLCPLWFSGYAICMASAISADDCHRDDWLSRQPCAKCRKAEVLRQGEHVGLGLSG